MSKSKELECPLCHEVQMQVYSCKEARMICRKCGASLLFTIAEDGSYSVNARPHDNKKKAS